MGFTISGGVSITGGISLTPPGGAPTPAPYVFQGSNYGYTSGGGHGSSIFNIIDKFSFTSDGNATDVGDLTQARWGAAGQSSSVSGYTSGGNFDVFPSVNSANTSDKFTFASDGNATDVGDLTQSRDDTSGQSSSTSGYSSGGLASGTTHVNTIDKFPFAVDNNATDVGDLTVARRRTAGQSSSVSGYAAGGYGPVYSNIIDKFPFASDGNATDVGDLTIVGLSSGRQSPAGQSSTVSGYTSGGHDGYVGPINVIEKFPFASDSNATDVGDITVARFSMAGQSSTASGYTSGGYETINIIDKFPFASDGNATDVGDLTQARWGIAGQQY